MNDANTLFLRLEGPLQAWGDPSKFLIRRTMEAPTKSGVLGLIACAMGLSRAAARERLRVLNGLAMGVRIDRPGTRWWDYHTVGAGTGLTTAGGGVKTGAQGTLITRREYLADASFLVALQGDPVLIKEIAAALAKPCRPVFLGRRSCPPSAPILAKPGDGEDWTNPAHYPDLAAALTAVPWRPLQADEEASPLRKVKTLIEWRAKAEGEFAPDETEVWYDVPISFDPPAHEPRFILRGEIPVRIGVPLLKSMPAPPRPRADYRNEEYRKHREERIKQDQDLCVFCKAPGPRLTVQHVTYRRAGGAERLEDLRTLCGLCHDAVTMLEYSLNMGLDRINPEDPRWRDRIIEKRAEIIKFRSLEIRRRRLTAEEV